MDQVRFAEIPVNSIEANPWQPRKRFDEDKILELAESIDIHGVLEPILVRRNMVGETQYQLVAGERRWRASMECGQETIPAIIRQLTDEEAADIALTENLQRQDLDAIEEAQAYETLLELKGCTQRDLGDQLGVSQGLVANRIRLLQLPEDVQDMISRKILSPATALALVKYAEFPELCLHLAEKIVDTNTSSKKAPDSLATWIFFDSTFTRSLDDNDWPKPQFDVNVDDWEPDVLRITRHGNDYVYTTDVDRWDRLQEEATGSDGPGDIDDWLDNHASPAQVVNYYDTEHEGELSLKDQQRVADAAAAIEAKEEAKEREHQAKMDALDKAVDALEDECWAIVMDMRAGNLAAYALLDGCYAGTAVAEYLWGKIFPGADIGEFTYLDDQVVLEYLCTLGPSEAASKALWFVVAKNAITWHKLSFDHDRATQELDKIKSAFKVGLSSKGVA